MYYIKQTEGKLSDAAKSFDEAVKREDYDAAIAIYESATGKRFPVNRDRVLWFRYNGAHTIQLCGNLTAEDWGKVYQENSSSYNRAKAAARIATERVGGTWEVVYDY